jgi:hypothetical protein
VAWLDDAMNILGNTPNVGMTILAWKFIQVSDMEEAAGE